MTATPLLAVRDALASRAREAGEPTVTVGDRALLVTLAHPDVGHLAGLAHRPAGDAPTIGAETVADLADLAIDADTRLERAIGIATLNALSAPDVDWQTGDPMALVSPDVERVVTVGLFRPALRKFSEVTVRVIERDPPASVSAPPDVTVETYEPADRAEAVAGADVCFITGSVLVYGGFDAYCDALAAAGVESVVQVGATASHLPGPAFDAGVDVVAGARVTAVDRVRERVRAGDCGTDLHDAGVEKVYVTADADAGGHALELNTRTETQP